MGFEVEPVESVLPEIKKLRGEVRDRYQEAVERLRLEGCKAAGYRIRADGAGDAAIPGLSKVGRPREGQPPCCDDLDDTPVDQELVDLVRTL